MQYACPPPRQDQRDDGHSDHSAPQQPLTLRKSDGRPTTKHDDVTVGAASSRLGRHGTVRAGPAARACEALDLESAGEPLVLVVAANQTALRQALGSKALTYSNVIGAVDSLAFAESDQLHVVACKLPPHVEAWTFDAKRGALPDLGRRRLEAALAKHTAPHFIVFGGDAATEEDDFDDDDGDDDAALWNASSGASTASFRTGRALALRLA